MDDAPFTELEHAAEAADGLQRVVTTVWITLSSSVSHTLLRTAARTWHCHINPVAFGTTAG